MEGASIQLRDMGFEMHVESSAGSRLVGMCGDRAMRRSDRSLPKAALGTAVDAPDSMT
jgi:hypothetical protein